MNWKSYTLVSGAGVLATWFAASQPTAPGNVPPPQPREAAGVAATASDIEQQAARLQARLQQHARYQAPARNLFRFTDGAAVRPVTPASGPAADTPLPPAPITPAPPIKLAAIATEGEARTAVLSTPGGIVLARRGDEVLGRFRVAAVDEDAVEIVAIADGAVTRLPLR